MRRVGEPGPDDNLFVQFYMGMVEDQEKTEAAGHPVFVDVPFIKIMVPGDKNTMIDTRADERYKQRFSELWRKFQANEAQPQIGMPITQWPAITRGQAEELKYLNITTVEQMAECADAFAHRIMNFQELKRKAAVYLAASKDSALATKLGEQLAARDARISVLEAEVAKFSKMFDAKEGTPAFGKLKG